MKELDVEGFSAWKEDPYTKALHALLRKWVEERQAEWRRGAYISAEGQWATTIANARAVSECDICDVILGIELDQLQSVENDES